MKGKLLFVIFLGVFVHHTSNGKKVLPFSLPTSKYCTPCDWDSEDIVDRNTSIIDGICRAYKRSSEPRNFATLVLAFYTFDFPYTNILMVYNQLMRAYETVYLRPYDLNIYAVSSTGNPDYCVQLIIEGEGFQKPINLTRMNKTIAEYYETGKEGETNFVNLLLDTWVNDTLGCSKKPEDVEKLVGRLLNAKKIWTRIKTSMVNTYIKPSMQSRYDPKTTTKFVQKCKVGAETVPDDVKKALTNCQGRICYVGATQPNCSVSRRTNEQLTENLVEEERNASVRSRRRISRPLAGDGKTYAISEFKHFEKSRPHEQEFIEIRVIPPPSILRIDGCRPMKIIIFTAYSKIMVRVIDLTGIVIPESGFFVLSRVDKDSKFHAASDFENEAWLPSGYSINEPLAVVLVEKEGVDSQTWETKFELSRTGSIYKKTPIDNRLLAAIKLTILDGQIYGKRLNDNFPDEVAELFPHSFQKCNCVLPTKESSQQTAFSFNLCNPEFYTQFTFQYEFFKSGTPSPGEENICAENEQFLCPKENESGGDTTGNAICPPSGNPALGVLKAKIETEIDVIKREFNASYTNKYYPVENFIENVWPSLKDYFDIPELPVRSFPFEFFAPGTSISDDENDVTYTMRFRCGVCHARLKNCNSSMSCQQKAARIAKGFQSPDTKNAFKRKLFNHLSSLQHLTSVLYDVQKDRNMYVLDKQNQFTTDRSSGNQQLANIIDVTYTILHTNSAPNNAPTWYALLRKLNANVGESMHSQETAFAITKLIADTGTNDILDYLVQQDEPFTLILDGSSDSLNNNYVVVYLQGLEGGVTSSFLVFLLKLKKDFSAIAYNRELLKAVEARGTEFEAYFKRRIVAIATDSAPTMKKFHKELSEWVDRRDFEGKPISPISIYCLAHRLQLATRAAFQPPQANTSTPPEAPIHYFGQLEGFMQSSYTYFKYSGRKMTAYREVMLEEHLPRVEMREFHTKRWIASEYHTVKNFITSITTARLTLQRIQDDQSIEPESKRDIGVLQEKLRDKTALITLHFLWDLTATFKVWSAHLQLLSGALIDQYKYFESLLEEINVLEEHRGPVLTEFLSQCICGEREVRTVSEFTDCEIIEWNNLTYEKTNKDAPTFHDASAELVKQVRERIDSYIPKKMLLTIHVLNPSKLPQNIDALRTQYPVIGQTNKNVYAGVEVKELAVMLGMNPDTLLVDWADLIESMLLSLTWNTNRQIEDANLFWAAALRCNLKWTNQTRLFVKSLKVISAGSVAVETGFSIFNNIKTKKQTALRDDHLESVMKVLINGPDIIEKFNSYKYAERWIMAGHKKPKVTIEEKSLETKSCIGANEEQESKDEDDLLDEDKTEHEDDEDESIETFEQENEELNLNDFTFSLPLQGNLINYEDLFTKDPTLAKSHKKPVVTRFRSRLM